MNKMIAAGFLTVAFAAAGACETTRVDRGELSDEAKARLAEFEKTGDRRNCLSLTQIDQIKPLSERVFLVRVGLNDYYLNETNGRCGGAGRITSRLQYRINGAPQLCRNEIVRVVDNTTGQTLGSCGIGDFERLVEKPDEDVDES
ncbi:MAG: hypothetical protein AAFY22_03795 [Pseudomonadota bacterium]